MCPNPSCGAHIFVVIGPGSRLLISYPPERLDFDPKGIPPSIVKSLEEAITCHANQCFIGAAIMVRKTLELLCAAQGASGANLYARIEALSTKVVLPLDLLDGLHDLRLLGNDAAHVESTVYLQVSQEEVEVAITVTKEVLKSIYQLADIIARMRALKKQTP